ncbi:MAG: hypothetical protein ACLFUS_14185 [Candidatus Sumerlaeia bacterium]
MKETLDIQKAVRKGNVFRDLDWFQQGLPPVPMYLANGAVGGCLDEFGVHSRKNYDMDNGRTHLTHVDHYSKRHDNGGHVLRSFTHILLEDSKGREPGLGLLKNYTQLLDLWTASVHTEWTEESSFKSHVFASWDQPQLWCWQLEQDLSDPGDGLIFTWCFDVRDAENNNRPGKAKIMDDLKVQIEKSEDGLWRIVSTTDCLSTEMLLCVLGGEAEIDGTNLKVTSGEKGVEMRALFVDRHLPDAIRKDPAAFLKRHDLRASHEAATAKFWKKTGMLDLPDGTPEASWWPRLTYYLPASLSPNPSHIQVASGLNANNWGHGFPQDQWYVMMALPRLGMHDLTAAQLPYYNDDLDAYRRYTKRMCKRDGVFFPWEAPFEKLDEFELDGPTNDNSYQFHNAAYVFAMVWESFQVHRDLGFLRKHVGLIEGVAEFMSNNCEEGDGGYIFRNDDIPLRSQDEATKSGAETVQPLCAVWGSMYVFRGYLECCKILDAGNPAIRERVAAILDKGFDFSDLIREDGTMRTSATDPRPHGQQKHPPQLNPLTYVPMGDWMEYEPVKQSWQRRYELCVHTREPRSLGWTFGQFALASARMGEGAGLESDLGLIQPARMADHDWMTFYECSHRLGWTHKKGAWYFTVMGLYVMTMLDTVIQDYRDGIDVLPALLPRWSGKPVAFQNVRLRGAILASGTWNNRRLELQLKAEKDIQTRIRVHPEGRYRIQAEGLEKNFSHGEYAEFSLKAGQEAAVWSR